MGAPKPHDPRLPQTTPEQVDARIAEILSEPADGLTEETDQLEAAHEVLHQSLQKN